MYYGKFSDKVNSRISKTQRSGNENKLRTEELKRRAEQSKESIRTALQDAEKARTLPQTLTEGRKSRLDPLKRVMGVFGRVFGRQKAG